MEQNSSHTLINILIGILILGAIVLVYFYLQTDTQDDTAVNAPTASQLSSQQITALINRLQNIKLDRGVVLRADFSSLQSTIQPIPIQPTGVVNPFRPGF